MNYFELFEIPESLTVDPVFIKKQFYILSRKYHPDFFSNELEADQTESLEKSSAVNSAYKIFTNPELTIQYFLKQKGLLEEEEKYQLSPAFLMQMMELNEELTDAKATAETAKIKEIEQSIQQLQTEIYEPVKEIVEHYQSGVTTEKELLQVKEYYYQKKYLSRILVGLH